MITSGAWGGRNLELRSRMAAYHVDGVRLGSIEWPTRSGSLDDTMLDKWSDEILGVALILGLISHEDVVITSQDAAGKKLEQPDLDVTIPGHPIVGVEQADVTGTMQRMHEAETSALSGAIRHLLDNDPAFARAFGNRHVTIFLSSHVIGKFRIEGKRDRLAIQAEVERFIRSGDHMRGATGANSFSAAYRNLHGRGATWHCAALSVPVFDIGHGANNASSYPAVDDVICVLDDHRKAAAKYRALPLWIVLLQTDRWDFLRNTLDAVASLNPPIDPFDRCYFADDTGRLLELRRGNTPSFTGMFVPGASSSPANETIKHAAELLQTVRRVQGDVHGTKLADSSLAYDVVKLCSVICGLLRPYL